MEFHLQSDTITSRQTQKMCSMHGAESSAAPNLCELCATPIHERALVSPTMLHLSLFDSFGSPISLTDLRSAYFFRGFGRVSSMLEPTSGGGV